MESNVLKLPAATKAHQAWLDYHEKIKEESRQREEAKHRVARIEKLQQKISPRYRGKTMEDFKIDYPEQHIVKKTAQRFIETFSDRLNEAACLMLLGKPGTGKTLLAFILYQALAQLGYVVSYEPSLQFLRKFQDSNFDSHGSFQQLLDSYINIQFLIIDEVTEGFSGKGGLLAEWEKQMLFALIDARYHANLCTLVISNRSKEEMIERIGERVVDRLSDKGLTLAFTWHSYRQSS